MQVLHNDLQELKRNKCIINTGFLFGLLVSENLGNVLLKLSKLILQSVHLFGLHDVLIF